MSRASSANQAEDMPCLRSSYMHRPKLMRVTCDEHGKTWQHVPSRSRHRLDDRPTTRFSWKIVHTRQLDWYDDIMNSSQARFEKNYVSRVKLVVDPDPDVFPGSRPSVMYVDIQPAASESRSSTREGHGRFSVGLLNEDHPAHGKRFRVTVVQQTNAQRADGRYVWGKDTGIRTVTIEPEKLWRPPVSGAISDCLEYADNVVDSSQLEKSVVLEEWRVLGEAGLEPAHAHVHSPIPEPSYAHLAHDIGIKVVKIWTSDCTCDDAFLCRFCKPDIPEYQRIWTDTIAGGDGLEAGHIDAPPAYDDTGEGSADIVLQKTDRLTAAGLEWLRSFWPAGNLDIIPPRYSTLWIELGDTFKRLHAVQWYLNDEETVVDVFRRLRDLQQMRDDYASYLTQADEDAHWRKIFKGYRAISSDLEYLEQECARRIRNVTFMEAQDLLVDLRESLGAICLMFGPGAGLAGLQERVAEAAIMLLDATSFTASEQRLVDLVVLRRTRLFYSHISTLQNDTLNLLWDCQTLTPWTAEPQPRGSFGTTHAAALGRMVDYLSRQPIAAWKLRSFQRYRHIIMDFYGLSLRTFNIVDRGENTTPSATRNISVLLNMTVQMTMDCKQTIDDARRHPAGIMVTDDDDQSSALEREMFSRIIRAFEKGAGSMNRVVFLIEKIADYSGCRFNRDSSPLDCETDSNVQNLESAIFADLQSLEQRIDTLEQDVAAAKQAFVEPRLFGDRWHSRIVLILAKRKAANDLLYLPSQTVDANAPALGMENLSVREEDIIRDYLRTSLPGTTEPEMDRIIDTLDRNATNIRGLIFHQSASEEMLDINPTSFESLLQTVLTLQAREDNSFALSSYEPNEDFSHGDDDDG